MLGYHDHVWITSALHEGEVEKALLLSFSLRRSHTSRKLAVFAASKFSPELRNCLHHAFDLVFYLDEPMNTTNLSFQEFAKFNSFRALGSFKKCVYVSNYMMAARNCDEIFDEETSGLFLLDRTLDTSVFAFEPGMDLFELMSCDIKKGDANGVTSLVSLLDIWKRNQGKDTGFLPGKYNKKMKQEPLLGNEDDIFMVNLKEFPEGLDDKIQMEKVAVLGKFVAEHWRKINEINVLPLLSRYSEANLSTAVIAGELSTKSLANEPVAIVGMSCRYPGANNMEEFWNLLYQGQDATCTPPDFRWSREQFPRQGQEKSTMNAGFLKVPVDEFDATFFGFSPKEVLFMDPQQRLLHELVWEALEDASLDPLKLRGTTGSVFVGSWTHDYRDVLANSTNSEFFRIYMGNSIGAAAARISFLLGMTGPSIATESGCSSSIVAVHLACKSLRQGETNLAVACGVNLLLKPFDENLMPLILSPDGHCKTFSEDANGFTRAEGAGVLVLKRLSDAQKDGDPIWGLIRGSAVSQEGMSKSLGTPTVHCESLAMQKSLRDADVSPEEVSYVEAHGTGTVMGDPVEVAAIAKAYSSSKRMEPLIIGSVKTNVGHTESCSGITGIMKVILAMQHESIPAHLNFSKLNPSIDLSTIPALIPLERREWKRIQGKSRIAGVSSFGLAGTDAHLILEEPPQQQADRDIRMIAEGLERPFHILKVSAKSDEALSILLERYKLFLQSSKDSIADISFCANTGRSDFPIRGAVVASSKEEMVKIIEQENYLKGEVNFENVGKICFLFPGQGSQYSGMAKQLYETSPIFRMHFDHCNKILKDSHGIDIIHILWSNSKKEGDELKRTLYSQTSIFCVEYSLSKLWETWGVKPEYVLGHSVGEFAAAVCAGILSVEDAIKLVAERSRLIDELPEGKMLVIIADKQQVDKAMKTFRGGHLLDYAAINASQQIVVAGDGDTVQEFSQFCTEIGIKCTILEATHAFHSRHMDPILDQYRSVLLTTMQNKGNAKCGYISGMKGAVVSDFAIDADYWVQHTREKVSFLNASKKAVEVGCQFFIEIGPQPALSALTLMNNESSLLCLPSLRRGENEWLTMLSTLAKLYVIGAQVKWKGLDEFISRKKIHLPCYPFIGKKFWPDADVRQMIGNAIHPLVGSVISNASPSKLFESGLNLETHEYLRDHAIGQAVVFPGAGYLEMSLAAGFATVHGLSDSLGKPSRVMKVENLNILAPLAFKDSKTTRMQTTVEFNTVNNNGSEFSDINVKIFHQVENDSSEKWLQHTSASFVPFANAEEQNVPFDKIKFENAISKEEGDHGKITEVYDKLFSLGLRFGPFFKSIERLWTEDGNSNKIFTKVKIPKDDAQYSKYIVHPVILDAMIQSIVMLQLTNSLKKKLYVPIKIGKFVWLSSTPTDTAASDLYIQTSTETTEGTSTQTSFALLLSSSGKKLAVMSGVEFIDTTARTMEALLEQQTSPLPDLWEEIWRPEMGPLEHAVDMKLWKMATSNLQQKQVDTTFASYNDRPDLQVVFDHWAKQVYYQILQTLFEFGWKPVVGDTLDENDLFENLKIEKRFRKQFGYFLQVFEEESILEKIDGNLWKVVQLPPAATCIQLQLADSSNISSLVHNHCTTLLSRVDENLGNILKGTRSALSTMFSDDSGKKNEVTLVDFYKAYADMTRTGRVCKDLLTGWLQSYKNLASKAGHQRYVFRVLEIGAGSGAATEDVLEVFEKLGIEFEYAFTDISTAFFPAAETRFEKYSKQMKFKKLNIESDPILQGFEPSSYDFVIAAEVLHATKNLSVSLANVNSLLKPAGTFVMIEQTRVSRYLTYIFGLLDGFWHFEDFDVRQDHCTLSKTAWIELLEQCDFSFVRAVPSANDYHSVFQMTARKDGRVGREPRKVKTDVKRWLLLHLEKNPLSNFLVDQIPHLAANREVVVVTRGEQFLVTNENEISIRPDQEKDFLQLMQKLNESSYDVEGVLYCWSLNEEYTSQEKILRPFFNLVKSLHQLKKDVLRNCVAWEIGSFLLKAHIIFTIVRCPGSSKV